MFIGMRDLIESGLGQTSSISGTGPGGKVQLKDITDIINAIQALVPQVQGLPGGAAAVQQAQAFLNGAGGTSNPGQGPNNLQWYGPNGQGYHVPFTGQKYLDAAFQNGGAALQGLQNVQAQAQAQVPSPFAPSTSAAYAPASSPPQSPFVALPSPSPYVPASIPSTSAPFVPAPLPQGSATAMATPSYQLPRQTGFQPATPAAQAAPAVQAGPFGLPALIGGVPTTLVLAGVGGAFLLVLLLARRKGHKRDDDAPQFQAMPPMMPPMMPYGQPGWPSPYGAPLRNRRRKPTRAT